MTSTEYLDRTSELTWEGSDLGRYLYGACITLEAPAVGVKRGTEPREDWINHMRRGLLSCNQALFEEFAFRTPMRCQVLANALQEFFEGSTEEILLALMSEKRLEFLADLIVYVRKHYKHRAQDQIVAACHSERTNKISREGLRLLLHLVPDDVIAESFRGVTTIDLSYELFCGKVLPRLSAFSNMRELKLASSDVQEQELVALTALPELAVLDLSATLVGNFGLEFLVNCPKLRVLRLSNCLVDDGAVQVLRQMKDRLESVTMSRQSMSESTVHELEAMLPKIIWLGKPDSTLQLG